MLAALGLMLLGVTIDFAVAPDQPLPYVYVDDPLIIEVRSDEDVVASLSLELSGARLSESVHLELESVALRAQGSRWIPLPEAPTDRGAYTLKLVAMADGQTSEQSAQFVRIDRPPSDSVLLPLFAYSAQPGTKALLALRSVGVSTLRLNAARPEIEDEIRTVVSQGFRIVLSLDPAQVNDAPQVVKHLAGLYCDSIVRWEVDPGGDSVSLAAIAEAIRAANCAASLAIVVSSPSALQHLLAMDAGQHVREVVLLQDAPWKEDIHTLRRVSEQAGYEGWKIHVLGRGIHEDSAIEGGAVVAQLLRNLAAGVSETGFDAALLYDGALNPALVYLNGFAHALRSTRYAGELDLGRGVFAPVFRSGANWLLPLVNENGAGTAKVEVGEARDLRLRDAFNNPQSVPEAEKGRIEISMTQSVLYLSGTGGSIPGIAARARARQLASEFTHDAAFSKSLPPEILELVAVVERSVGEASGRVNFFNLLQLFPELERRWHTGQIPETVAVPALALLARLARALCAVEELRGEPFLEPLQDTVARGEDYQSLYLTGSTGIAEPNGRGDWLLEEVRALLDEVDSLLKGGQKIEAGAVAILAEWRARGLEHAARAGAASQVPETLALLPDEPPVVPREPEVAAVAAPEPVPVPAPEAIRKTHVVRGGENPSVIAKQYNVKLDDFLAWNKLTKSSRIKIGAELLVSAPGSQAEVSEAAEVEMGAPEEGAPAPIPEEKQAPVSEAEPEAEPVAEPEAEPEAEPVEEPVEEPAAEAKAEPVAEPEAEPAPEEPQKLVHKVVSGDTPGGIARKYGVSLEDLLKWNNLRKVPVLRIGDEYVLHPKQSPESLAAAAESVPVADEVLDAGQPKGTRKIVHTVERGDTTGSIAAKYGVAEAEFSKWNGLRKNATLARGKQYTVYVPAAAAASAPSGTKKIVHTVVRGDNPSVIAQKYGVRTDDFMTWNKLTKRSVLHIGEKYDVYVPQGR